MLCLTPVPSPGTPATEVRRRLGIVWPDSGAHRAARRGAYVNSIPDGQVAQEYEPNGSAAQEVRDLYRCMVADNHKCSVC